MRKGFTLTLMAVATAMLGTQAQAMAPVISDIPSPIVGSAEPVTGSATNGRFVYLDAIDLDQMATDDVTAPSALMWTYTGPGAAGASKYLINGVNPINLSTTDPTSPTTALIINRNDADPVPGKDSFKNTITIRNKSLSPLPMTTVGTDPGVTGIVPAQTETVTFFCSDGNAVSSDTVFFYTDNGNNDRLSGGDPFKVVMTDKITAMWATNPMEWAPTPPGNNGITQSRPTGLTTGVCLNANPSGDNMGSVITAFPYFNMAANQVYRIKMKMSNSNVTPGNMPFWDIILENYETHTGKGLNLYSMDTLVFPNEGAGNALSPTASYFTWYWTPPAVATAQWNNASTGAFTAANDAVNDPRLRFRLFDYGSTTYPVGQGDLKSGLLCMLEVEVAAASVTRATTVGSPLVNLTSLAAAGTTGGNVEFVPLGGATGAFASGALTVTATGASATQEFADLRPATDTTFSVDPASAQSADNFPIAWKSGKILRLQVGMSAPTATDEANPMDAYAFLFNTMTNEINMESYQTSNKNMGSVKVGTPQTYTTFFYTGTETKSTVAGYHKLRWYMRFVNDTKALFPNGQTTNTGATRVHSVKVDEVIFK